MNGAKAIAVLCGSNDRRVGRTFGSARRSLILMAFVPLVGILPVSASVAATAAPVLHQGETIDDFYRMRGGRPLWLVGGRSDADTLLAYLRTADADGLVPDAVRLRDLERMINRAERGSPAELLRADRLLSLAFVNYVRDLRRTPGIDMIWVDPQLRPSVASPRQLLDQAAAAPSLDHYLTEMRWMNPIYAGLRKAIVNGGGQNRDLLTLNLERARALPAGKGRFVIVNASAADLSMVEDGRTVGWMRVVVGKPIYPTPMMAALIRFTSLNPYWNVPPDLAAERIAPNVVKAGLGYLKSKGYQLLTDWGATPSLLDPATIDWRAVAAGRQEVRIRQLPGPSNAMGRMKFMFPNTSGVYLHDTPEKELLGEQTRMFSGGCVRLEDAPRLARWLYDGNPPSTRSAKPEQRVDLPRPVPVFLTYLTALPTRDGIAYLPDVYHRDPAALAALSSSPGYRIAARAR